MSFLHHSIDLPCLAAAFTEQRKQNFLRSVTRPLPGSVSSSFCNRKFTKGNRIENNKISSLLLRTTPLFGSRISILYIGDQEDNHLHIWCLQLVAKKTFPGKIWLKRARKYPKSFTISGNGPQLKLNRPICEVGF